jgi:hypothetical protein
VVAQNIIECDREQELLLPPSSREWLPDEHLAWFVIDAVAEIDLEPFYSLIARMGGVAPRSTRRWWWRCCVPGDLREPGLRITRSCAGRNPLLRGFTRQPQIAGLLGSG